ncbi:ABC transporter substrate-binding protein [Brevibacillus sp. NRS-1366]|uniref:ABC transporter substrate-binding protein n=1 Tax=Brevibacillus sp. NRS-1366 TaxID=3233899 RepID=UPI003D22FB09
MKVNSRLIGFLLLVISLIFTGCGNTNTSTTGTTTPSQSGEPKQEKKEAGKLTEITISEPVRVLSFAPLYVAIEKGFFKEEGLDVKIASGGGGSQVMATIISGQAQFGVAAPNAALKTLSAGKEPMVVQSLNSSLTYDIVLSDKFLEKKGIDPAKQMSTKEKVEMLRGATLATNNIGDSGDVFLRYTMELYGQKSDDIKVVKVNGLGPKIATMKQGVIDGGINSAPFALETADKKAGRLWISSFEIPEYSNMIWEVLFTSKEFANKNHDLVVAAVRAVGKGIEFTRENPKESAKLIEAYFSGTSTSLIENGLSSLEKTFVGHGEMTKEAWDNAQTPLIKYSKLTGIEAAADTNPGTFWTNQYIEEAFGK